MHEVCIKAKACVAEWLTSRSPDLEVWSSNLALRVLSLDKELYSNFLPCPFTKMG